MNFNEFLVHAKKVDCLNLSILAEEVGSLMVLHPETCMRVIEKALAPVESPEGIRWDFLSASLNEGMTLDVSVVVATSPWCLKLLGSTNEIADDSGKGFCLAILNGLDVEEKFYNYFDFKKYWEKNGGDTITTQLGVYLVNSEEISKRFTELSNSGVF